MSNWRDKRFTIFPSILILISKVSSFGSKWISDAFLAKAWAITELSNWIAGASSSLLSIEVLDSKVSLASLIGIIFSRDSISSLLTSEFFLKILWTTWSNSSFDKGLEISISP